MGIFGNLFATKPDPRKAQERKGGRVISLSYGPGNDYWYSVLNGEGSPDTAMQVATVQSCVRVRSQTIGSLPLNLYRKTETGKERAEDHPLYSLLHDAPSPDVDSLHFRETGQADLDLRGDTFAYKDRSQDGQLRRLIRIHPDFIEPRSDERDVRFYLVRNARGETRRFERDEIFHLMGITLDGLKGVSPIQWAASTVSLSKGAETFGASMFKNGARPGGVIEVPGSVADEELKRFADSWKQKHGSADNASKVAFLEEGWKWVPVQINPNEAQFLETRKYQRSEICGLFNTPPHLIGDLERSTFSNIEHQSIEFVTHCIRPIAVRWEQALNLQLLTEADRAEGLFFEFNLDALLRGDTLSTLQAISIGIQNGIYSINDARRILTLNAVDGGDRHYIQQNMMPIDKVDEVLEQKNQPAPRVPASNGFASSSISRSVIADGAIVNGNGAHN